VILATAAQRADRVVLPLPKSLKLQGGALKAALNALLRRGLVEEQLSLGDAPVWREVEDGRRVTLVLTDTGLRAINADEGRAAPPRSPAAPSTSKPRGGRPGHSKPKARNEAGGAPGTGSKQALLIELLKRKSGASIAEISAATGWQSHSVRGAISGTLQKKLGLTVTRELVKRRGRVYRIAGHG
jgi:DNA-binding MarR family transcriptional regulator